MSVSVYTVKTIKLESVERWSNSKQEFINVEDMNWSHVLNALRKDLLVEKDNEVVINHPLFRKYFQVLAETEPTE